MIRGRVGYSTLQWCVQMVAKSLHVFTSTSERASSHCSYKLPSEIE